MDCIENLASKRRWNQMRRAYKKKLRQQSVIITKIDEKVDLVDIGSVLRNKEKLIIEEIKL